MKQQFYLGQWQVDVTSNTLSLGKLKRTIEPKTMDVLLLLCQQKGEVVSSDEIVAQCWPKHICSLPRNLALYKSVSAACNKEVMFS